MANRSYLYVTTGDPRRGELGTVLAQAEWPSVVPYTHLALLSGGPQACASIGWIDDRPIAVCGDIVTGRARLFEFLDAVRARGLLPVAEVDEGIAAAHRALDRIEGPAWVLVEPAEILALSAFDEAQDLGSLNQELVLGAVPTVKLGVVDWDWCPLLDAQSQGDDAVRQLLGLTTWCQHTWLGLEQVVVPAPQANATPTKMTNSPVMGPAQPSSRPAASAASGSSAWRIIMILALCLLTVNVLLRFAPARPRPVPPVYTHTAPAVSTPGGALTSAAPGATCADGTVTADRFSFVVPHAWECVDTWNAPVVVSLRPVLPSTATPTGIDVSSGPASSTTTVDGMRAWAETWVNGLLSSGYDTSGLEIAADPVSIAGQQAVVLRGTTISTLSGGGVTVTAKMNVVRYWVVYQGDAYTLTADSIMSDAIVSQSGVEVNVGYLDDKLDAIIQSWQWR